VICGSRDVCSSPQLFAAYHDLLRQTAPKASSMDPFSLDHILKVYALLTYPHLSTSSCPAFLRRLPRCPSQTTVTPRTGPVPLAISPLSAALLARRTHDARSSFSPSLCMSKTTGRSELQPGEIPLERNSTAEAPAVRCTLRAFNQSHQLALLRRAAFMCTKPKTYPSASPGLRSL
jgi:hypothetical protein